MNYIISQYLVFEKNDQGGILPETRWSRRTRLYNEGRAEALSNWKEYDNALSYTSRTPHIAFTDPQLT